MVLTTCLASWGVCGGDLRHARSERRVLLRADSESCRTFQQSSESVELSDDLSEELSEESSEEHLGVRVFCWSFGRGGASVWSSCSSSDDKEVEEATPLM